MEITRTKIALTLVASSAVAVTLSAKDPEKRPNIVYIMSDDHSMQTISAYGYGLNSTPNIDRLAETGCILNNNFVSNSISGPCRAVVLTGKFSHINGFRDNQPHTVFDGSQQTFPKLLQAAGYQTAVIGKWHLGSTPTGFDYYSVHVGQGTYYSPVMIEPDGKHTYKGEYATDLTLGKSIEWIADRDTTRPFCLMMHFKAPHRNWMPAPDKMDMYEDTEFPVPDTFYDDYEGREAAAEQKMSIAADMLPEWDLKMVGTDSSSAKGMKLQSELSRMTPEQRDAFNKTYLPVRDKFVRDSLTGKALAEWKYQRYMRDYCKVISSVDDMVGRMLDYLEENDLLDNTVIIYTSDQGFYMGEHGWFDKRFMYEESLHTPFLISYPGHIDAGTECNALTQNIDVAPTILDFAGVEIPDDIQGESLKPVLEGKKGKVRDAVYYHYYEFPMPHAVKKHYGIRTERYKLIHFYDDINTWELFDLKEDPKELRNLVNDPSYAGIKKSLMKQLEKLQKQYKDIDPEKD